LSPAELRLMLRGYYEARKWDERGFVPDRKLAQLGIASTADEDVHAKR